MRDEFTEDVKRTLAARTGNAMFASVRENYARQLIDYPALAVANRIYGGMSDNRIWKNIRQQHGIAYYASSELSTFPGVGLWTILSPVQQDSTALAMREFEKELAAFGRTKPITQVELDQAKTGLIRALPVHVWVQMKQALRE